MKNYYKIINEIAFVQGLDQWNDLYSNMFSQNIQYSLFGVIDFDIIKILNKDPKYLNEFNKNFTKLTKKYFTDKNFISNILTKFCENIHKISFENPDEKDYWTSFSKKWLKYKILNRFEWDIIIKLTFHLIHEHIRILKPNIPKGEFYFPSMVKTIDTPWPVEGNIDKRSKNITWMVYHRSGDHDYITLNDLKHEIEIYCFCTYIEESISYLCPNWKKEYFNPFIDIIRNIIQPTNNSNIPDELTRWDNETDTLKESFTWIKFREIFLDDLQSGKL